MSEDVRHIHVMGVALRNQIAAGEVVERPASVLKELVENSLDAGARQINCNLENGGQGLLEVQDDGCGIPKEELALALTAHATSKIRDISDLVSIHSHGFRGEALASIASVAEVSIRSHFGGEAARLDCIYGVMGEETPCNLPNGTCVTVKNLFANVPARLKFLKAASTELRHVQDMLFRMSLAYPEVDFRLCVEGKEIMHLLANQPFLERLGVSWPKRIVAALRPFELKRSDIHVHGYASVPTVTQLKGNKILVYVNGRAVSDKRIVAAVREAYKGRLTSRDFPMAVIFIEVDPREVDVNVHPAKTEVRFQDESLIFRNCVAAVRSTLDAASQTQPSIHSSFGGNIQGTVPETKESPSKPFSVEKKEETNSTRRPMGFWGSLDEQAVNTSRIKVREDPEPSEPWSCEIKKPEEKKNEEKIPEKKEDEIKPVVKEAAPQIQLQYMGQILDTYLLFSEQGKSLWILDQHAAHERVLYEKLLHESLQGKGQAVLIPFDLPLHSAESLRFQELRSFFSKVGFELILEQGSLRCSAIPSFLSLGDAKEFLHNCLDGVLEDNSARLKSMACHGAIKAGQKLTREEANDLLKQWFATEEHDFCPHGRPAVLRYDAAVLERLFKRKE